MTTTTATAATTATTSQTTMEDKNMRKLRRTSSTGSLELNLLQDEEDGLMQSQQQQQHQYSQTTIGGNINYSGDNDDGNDNDNDGMDARQQQIQQQLHLRDNDSNNNNNNNNSIRSEPLQQQQQQQQRDHVHYLSALFAGVGSGALSSFICAPLDLIRTRMQVWGDIQQQAQKTPKGTNRNAIPSIGGPAKAFKAILKKEGPKGMFRGLGATLVTVPLFWGVYFPLYDETKDVLTHRQQFVDVSEYHPGVVHCLSAIMTGAVADVICNPFFVVRTRLQTEALHELTAVPVPAPAGAAGAASKIADSSSSKGSQQKRISMLQMARRLKEQHGMPVFWRGMTANLIGLSHCAVQFPAYEYLKGYLRNERENNNGNRNNFNSFDNNNNNNNNNNTDNTVTELLIASGLAKMTASLLSYPHEVLRSRMVDSRSSKSPTLTGTAQQIMRREGIVGFYNGLGVTLVRVIPNCCVTFLSYELILKHSKEYFRE